MKENSIKKEQSSIEEDIERLKLCSTNQCYICGRYEKEECMLERNRCEHHILSDYKRVLEMNEVLLKENELLRKDIEGWKKYCEEIEKDQTEMSNKNCELEFEVEKLQKENEECQRAYQEEKDEQFDFINKISSNDLIPVQKVKDKIETLEKIQKEFPNNERLEVKIIAYKELLVKEQ